MFLALVVFAAADLPAAAPDRVRGALRRSSCSISGAPYAFYNTVWWHVQGFHYNPWFDWLLGGFVTDTWQKKVWSAARHRDRARRRVARRPLGRDVRAAARSARGAGRVTAAAAAPAPGVARAGGSHHPAATAPPGMASRWGPLTLVGLTCLFGLVDPPRRDGQAVNLNDSAFHLQMVRWAGGQIREGRVPLDGWYPVPLARLVVLPPLPEPPAHPHRLRSRASPARATRRRTSGSSTCCSRCGRSRLRRGAAARLGTLDRRGRGGCLAAHRQRARATATSTGATPGGATACTRSSGRCGCCRSPGALTWRAVSPGQVLRGRRGCARADDRVPLHHGLPRAAHGRRLGARRRRGLPASALGRAAVVVGGSVLVASWVLVPLIGDTKWTTQSEFYKGSVFNDSYGAREDPRLALHGRALRLRALPDHLAARSPSGVGVCAAQARCATSGPGRCSASSGSACCSSSDGRRSGPLLDRPARHPATSRSTAS